MSANVSVSVSVCASLHQNVWEHPFRHTMVCGICDAAANLDVYMLYRCSHCCIAPDVQRGCSAINLTTALLQRPDHRAEGAMMVASDHTRVFTEVVIPCPYGELVATAAMPREFLVSSCAAQLSNDEVALLSVLNAGVPNELKAGKPHGYRVLHLVGLLTHAAAAELICRLSKDCQLDAAAMGRKFTELDRLLLRLDSKQRCRLVSLRLIPRHVEVSQQADREHAAALEAAQNAAHTVNDQLQRTAVERAAIIGSNSRTAKSDSMLTRGSKLGRARGQRVVIGGVELKSLNKDLLASHRGCLRVRPALVRGGGDDMVPKIGD